jgi:hypothetical protein
LTDTIMHGTEWAWRTCRKRPEGACEACKKAKNDNWTRNLAKRRKEPIPDDARHGTEATYRNGCHCDECSAEMRAIWAAQKRRQREEAAS